VLVPVRLQRRYEEPFPERGLLRPGHVLQDRRDTEEISRTQVAVVGLLAVRRDDADVAGLVDKSHQLVLRVVRIGAAPAQAGHRPDLKCRRRRNDAAVHGARGEFLVGVDGIAVAERVRQVTDHRQVHRIPCNAAASVRLTDELLKLLGERRCLRLGLSHCFTDLL
jgi:hypothetical protein